MTSWTNIPKLWLASIALLFGAFFAGCGGEKDLKTIYDGNIKKLHACYSIYLDAHGQTGPKNEEEFKTYLKEDPTAVFLLKKIDVTPENVDEFFVSDRDEEPFVIRYGVRGMADHAVIFEKTGVDGKRLVAFGTPRELEADEYDGYLSGKLKGEAPPRGAGQFDVE